MFTVKTPSVVGLLSVGALIAPVVIAADLGGVEVSSSGETLEWVVPEKNPLDHEHKPNSIMLRFHESASLQARAELLAEVGGTVKQSYQLVPDLKEVDLEVSVAEALARIGNRSDVLQYVEPNFIFRAFATPNDPLYPNLYGMEAINGPGAWDNHVGDPDFMIAIIDTGMDYNHQDIAANAWTNPGEIPGNGQDDDGNGYVDDVHGFDFYDNEGDPMDGNGHGTHCSGTVGGVGNNGIGVAGVNWQCDLVGVQFLSPGGSGSTADAVSAVQYCAVMDIKVSNNSWGGGGFTQSLYDAIANAGSQDGHIFCAAAGNGGSFGASYPAAYDLANVIAVAATDSNDNLAGFSQYHPTEVDLGAPGVDVQSSVPGNSYDYYSGTSMATPHVAGGVGLVYSLMGDATAAEVKAIILDNVRPLGSLDGNCLTGGILDVEAAVGNTFLGPTIELLTSVPDSMDPNVATTYRINVDPREDTLLIGSVKMQYRMSGSGSYSTVTMTQDGLNKWIAELPGADCEESPEFYFQAEGQTAGTVTEPSAGASAPYGFFIGEMVVSFSDDFNSDTGWTVSSDASDGQWERATPITNCDRGNPGSDFDGSGPCYVTDNSSSDGCNSDVDDGSTILTSPVFDAGGSEETLVSYARWHSNDYGSAPGTDPMVVDISNDAGLTWTNLETIGPTGEGTTGGWNYVSHTIADVIAPTDQMRIRFTVSDLGSSTQSVVESGVDAFSVEYVECDPGTLCVEDVNGDNQVNVEDLLIIIAQFGGSGSGDVDGNGVVDTNDLLIVIAAWGPCGE